MARFAVSHINWGNHELTTEIIEAVNWQEAAITHPKIAELFPIDQEDEEQNWPIPDTQEEAKVAAFDQDAMINIVEIPEKE